MKNNQKLTVLMATEYFDPFVRGGSEVSTRYLSEDLKKRGHKIVIVTPNYGAKHEEVNDGIKMYRFGIGRKLKTGETLTPFWHTNLFWFLKSFLALLKAIRQEKVDIIHVQGKYFLPAAILVARVTRLPVVFTARDYQILCPLGFCLWGKDKACHLTEYFTKDFSFYTQYYLQGSSWMRVLLQGLFLVRARWIKNVLYFFARQADVIVTTSLAQQRIFKANGLPSRTIYNTVNFSKKPLTHTRRTQLVFAGRLTPGKGVHVLVPALAKVRTDVQPKLLIIGDGILKPKLQQQVRDHKLTDQVGFVNNLKHHELLKLYRQSVGGIFPSLWPENFGRGALEAISQTTPVITSLRGGLPEIVQGRYGLSVEPNERELAKAIERLLKNHSFFVDQIKKNWHALSQQFDLKPTSEYEHLYYQLTTQKR